MVAISRGDVVLCDLNPVVGTEQAGVRPVVILQIDRANAVSPHNGYCSVYVKDSPGSSAFARLGSRRSRWLESGFCSPL